MSDTELLDWAANHPDIVMRELTKWWAVSGPRWREIFHFRTIMQIAYRKHTTESEV